jgi:hypothetical protein
VALYFLKSILNLWQKSVNLWQKITFVKNKNPFYMKKLFLLLLVIPFTFSAFAQTTAVEYNDLIVDEQNKIGQRIIDFNYAVEAGEEMDLPLKLILEQINVSIEVVEKVKPWEDGAALKSSALSLFRFYKSIVAKEYQEMVNILKKENIAESDVAQLDVLLASITEREAKLDADFAYQQETFAKRWNIELAPSELQDELDKISE